jgi:tetratricopeptide (TPR) repeat protein
LLNELAAELPDDAVALCLAGVAEASRDGAKAHKLLMEASRRKDTEVRARLELARLATKELRPGRAVTILRPMRKRSYQAAYRSAEILESVGSAAEAVRAYDQAARLAGSTQRHKDRVLATLASARLRYQLLGRRSDALRSLEAIPASVLEGLEDSELRARVQIHEAALLRLNRRAAHAETVARATLKANPVASHAAGLQLGLALSDLGRHPEAAQVLGKALGASVRRTERSKILVALGRAEAGRGRPVEARGKFDEALGVDPYNIDAILADALLLITVMKEDNAGVGRAMDLAKIDPRYVRDTRVPSDVYDDDVVLTLRELVKVLEQVVKRQPYRASAWAALGVARHYAGLAGAREALGRAIKEDTGLNPVARLYLGLEQDMAGRCRNALPQYEAASGGDLQGAPLYTAMGACYLREGQSEKAEELMVRALADDPTYAPAHYWYGNLAKRQGDGKAALERWKDAIKHEPRYLPPRRAMYELGS